jgi:hypothetical protein
MTTLDPLSALAAHGQNVAIPAHETMQRMHARLKTGNSRKNGIKKPALMVPVWGGYYQGQANASRGSLFNPASTGTSFSTGGVCSGR